MNDDPTPPSSGSTGGKRRRLAIDSAAKATIAAVGVGSTLDGRYLLEAELGRGGMGVVYRAHDAELDQPVAVKVLPPELAGSKRAVSDLKREAVLAMRLRHPGIVALHHFALDAGAAFLVLELLEGQTLEDRLDATDTLTPTQAADIAEPLAAALDYAHAEGVVHRDVKPANVFLHKRGDGEQVRLMDFGIARQVMDSMSRVSRSDSAGTLLYMSPEQLQGRTTDGRTDVYALAATVYECLAGHPPFYQGGISHQIVSEPVPPIEGVPDAVNQVLARALAKKPEGRPATAGAFAGELRVACEAQGVPPCASQSSPPSSLPSSPPPPPPPPPAPPAPPAPPKAAPPTPPAPPAKPAGTPARPAPPAPKPAPAPRGSCLGRLFCCSAVLLFLVAGVLGFLILTGVASDQGWLDPILEELDLQDLMTTEPTTEPTMSPTWVEPAGPSKGDPSQSWTPPTPQPPTNWGKGHRPLVEQKLPDNMVDMRFVVSWANDLLVPARVTLVFAPVSGGTTISAWCDPYLQGAMPGMMPYAMSLSIPPGTYNVTAHVAVRPSYLGAQVNLQERVVGPQSFLAPDFPDGRGQIPPFQVVLPW